jgi:hypothetical protein
MWRSLGRSAAVVTLALAASSCATLDNLRQLVQAPTFEEADNQPAEIRLEPSAPGRPLGGATVRLWTRVRNPNPFGVTLTTLDGTLLLEGSRAATASFPLGLPLEARQESVIPLDLSLSFADLPRLGGIARRVAERQPVAYTLEGTIGVNAGRLGQPVFGPMPLVRGEIRR